jgi:hypothetical protein
VRSLAMTDGVRLARAAVKLDFSVQKIAFCTGATRATVYNWYNGHGVTRAYQSRVHQLTKILKDSPNGDAAWSTACLTFNLPSSQTKNS